MAGDSNQLELKKILVDLEDERNHLRASIGHLEHEIQKRELEVENLLAERELSYLRVQPAKLDVPTLTETIQLSSKNDNSDSKFNQQVEQLLKSISRTSEEVFSIIQL